MILNELMVKLELLRFGSIRALCLHPDGLIKTYSQYKEYKECSYYVLPTAANPLHKGHLHMANFVSTIRDIVDGKYVDCEFELSMSNVDKGNVPIDQIHNRLLKFRYLARTCWVTTFSTFVQKSNFFHDTQFVVGTDTANRIVDPKYYYNCEEERDRALDDIFNNGCTFMVLGRPGHVLNSEYFDDEDHDHIFFIEDYNGHDISSTKIRYSENSDLLPFVRIKD